MPLVLEYSYFFTTTDSPKDCESCPGGKVSRLDRMACDDCGEHAKSRPLSSRFVCYQIPKVQPCDVSGRGTFANLTTGSCELCSLGRYSPTGAECLDCGEGFETLRSTGAYLCSGCDSGRFSPGNVVNCSVCSAGRFSGSRAGSCTNWSVLSTTRYHFLASGI